MFTVVVRACWKLVVESLCLLVLISYRNFRLSPGLCEPRHDSGRRRSRRLSEISNMGSIISPEDPL